jgi:hypothetical protein
MPFDVKPRIFMRGGNRNRAERVTLYLTEREVTRLAQAMLAAKNIGFPLNRMITIHWERAGVPEKEAVRATGQFLALLRNAVGFRSFAHIWIRENDYGDGVKGDHVHILAHIPEGFDLGRKQRARIKAITGEPYLVRVIRTSRVGGTANAARTSPEHYHVHLGNVAHYVLKGGARAVKKALGLGCWGDGGRVVGQRCGMSRNLSRMIRQRPIA